MTQHAKSRKEGKITKGMVLALLKTGMLYERKTNNETSRSNRYVDESKKRRIKKIKIKK